MPHPNWNLIANENPELSIHSVEQIGEGWSCVGYLVNEAQAFKIPKLDCWDELMAEIVFLETLGQQLPLTVPRPLYHRRISEAAPFGYAAYSYILGDDLNLEPLASSQRQAAIDDLAHFLRALHDLNPSPELSERLYVETHLELAKTARRLLEAAETEIVPKLSSQEADALYREFARHIEQYQPTSFTPCLLHRDICTGNIRMVNGVISGVIDFGNIVLGDPETEFSEIYLEQGKEVLLAMAQRYGHDEPNRLIDKMWRLSIVNQVEVIIDDVDMAPAEEWALAWTCLRKLLRESVESRRSHD